MQSIWLHPLWHELQEKKVVDICDVPLDTPLTLWQKEDIFLIHPSQSWHALTLASWEKLYLSLGIKQRPLAHNALNSILKNMYNYQDSTVSHTMATALWLAVWTDTPLLWLHPQYDECHSTLKEIITQLIADPQLSVRWIRCSFETESSSLSWNSLYV